MTAASAQLIIAITPGASIAPPIKTMSSLSSARKPERSLMARHLGPGGSELNLGVE